MASEKRSRPWQFPDNEVRVLGGDENVLGKGAYGEVRKAVWRGIPVAAKRLHMLSGGIPGMELGPEEVEAVRQAFVQEMEMLSYLRHPNLLLFIGVSYNAATRTPLWIVTELMTTSLYSIIHDKKIELTLAEIIDTALGVVSGLQYLHGHDPPIIHRDISAKNILMDGANVKISDLGQAKFFDHTSRQTAAPGALVYAAPEVLTGRYTPKIDIFSFGVLLVQMCVGHYPSIESRPAHVEMACKKYPALQHLITACISLDPDYRPAASEAAQMLRDIMITPQYTSCSHEHAGGVVIERVFRSAMERAKEEGVARGKLAAEAEWSKKYENMKVAAHKYRAKGKDLERLITATQERVTKAAEVQAASQRTVRDLEDEVAVLRRQNRNDKELAEQDIGRIAQENANLRSQLTKAEDRMEQLEKQIVSERRERVSLESALRNISERMKTTRQTQSASEQKAEATLRMLESVEERLGNREEELEAARKTIADYEQQIRELQEVIKHVRRELDMETSSRKQLAVRVADLKDQAVRQSERTATLESDLEEARAQAEAAVDDRDRAVAEAKEARELSERNAEAAAKYAASAPAPAAAPGDDVEAELDRAGFSTNGAAGDTSAIDALLDDGEMPATPDRRTKGGRSGGEQVLSFTNAADGSEPGTPGGVTLPRLPSAAGSSTTGAGEMLPAPRALSSAGSARAGKGFGSETGGGGGSGGAGAPADSDADAPSRPPGSRKGTSKALVESAKRLGIEALVSAMREHPTRVGVQWRSLNALRELASESDEARAQIAIHGGISAVLIAMRTFPGNVNTAHFGARALMNLAFQNDLNRSQIVSAGGPPVIIDAMKMFPDDSGVQGFGCGALANLAHNDADAGVTIAREGGVDVVLTALYNFSRSSSSSKHRVLQKGCWAILALASSDFVASHVASKGGVETVLDAMRSCTRRPEVQQYGAWALANVCWSDVSLQERAIAAGGIEVCEAALEMYAESHPGVAEKAELALRTITSANRGDDVGQW